MVDLGMPSFITADMLAEYVLLCKAVGPALGKLVSFFLDLFSVKPTFGHNRALSMARKFPHVQVLGVDLAPVPLNPELLTPNISFEMDNINLGLAHHVGRFDLVHMRCTTGGLSDYASAITTAANCLKPGGLLLLVEFEGMFCAEDMVSAQKMATPNQPNGSWIQRFCYGMCTF